MPLNYGGNSWIGGEEKKAEFKSCSAYCGGGVHLHISSYASFIMNNETFGSGSNVNKDTHVRNIYIDGSYTGTIHNYDFFSCLKEESEDDNNLYIFEFGISHEEKTYESFIKLINE